VVYRIQIGGGVTGVGHLPSTIPHQQTRQRTDKHKANKASNKQANAMNQQSITTTQSKHYIASAGLNA